MSQEHRAVFVCALVFIAALFAGTIFAAIDGGPDILTVVSALVLAMLGFGIFGALREPPHR